MRAHNVTRMQRGNNLHGQRRFWCFLGWLNGKNLDNFKGRNNSYLFLKNGIFRHRIFGFGSNVRGAILVEFAFSIPILLAILYYMHDLPRIARIHERMEFCAHCAVNMLQNISRNKEDKKITLQDYKYISATSFLPYYGGGTKQYGTLTRNYQKPCGQMSVCYIKGTGNNKARMVWAVVSSWGCAPPLRGYDVFTSGKIPAHINVAQTIVGQEMNSKSIYKDLEIQDGEVKIMIDAYLNASWCPGMSGDRAKPYLFGLLIHSPKAQSYGSNTGGWFHHYIIFTPNPGLFDETPPS